MSYTDKDLRDAVESCDSKRQICNKLGLAPSGQTMHRLNADIDRLRLSTSHFRCGGIPATKKNTPIIKKRRRYLEQEDIVELVKAAQNGDKEASGKLLDDAHGLIRSTVRKNANPADVDDLVQDVMVIVLSKIDSCTMPERFLAWVRTIAKRTSWGHYRKIKAKRTIKYEIPPKEFGVEEVPEREEDVELERMRFIRDEAISRLPKYDRKLLRLIIIKGLSTRDVSRKWGIPFDKLRWQRQKAMLKLKKLTAELDAVYPEFCFN